MRQRLPLILSLTALVVALLGSTPLGQAAVHLVGKAVPLAKVALSADDTGKLDGHTASANPRAGQIPVLGRTGKLPLSIIPIGGAGGSRGPAGPTGPAGPAGPAGTAGSEQDAGSVFPGSDTQPVGFEPQGLVGWQSATRSATGTYCLAPSSSTPGSTPLLLSLGSEGAGIVGFVVWLGYCTASTGPGYAVGTYDTNGTLANDIAFTAVVP